LIAVNISGTVNIAVGTRLLLHIWRGLNGADHDAQVEQDWESFLAACEYHQVSPIVFHRVANSGGHSIPLQVLDQLRVRFYRISAYNYHLAMHLAQLVAQFERLQIPCLALKGPTVALMAYGDLSLRQYEDIDIMVRVEDVPKAVAMLFDRGYQPAKGHAERHKDVKRYHEITLTAPDNSHAVDLHWQLAPPYAQVFGPDPSTLWRQAVKLRLPHGDVSVLAREDMFLTLCQHGTRHRWWQLKWLVDVAELLSKAGGMDWSRVEDLVRLYPLAHLPAGLAVLLARELLGTLVPADVAKIFEPDQRTSAVARAIRDEFFSRGQTNGSAHDTLLGLERRPSVRAKYLAGEAVQYPVRNVLFTITRKDFQYVQLPDKLRVLYYLIRPLRLMIQHGRGAARRIWSLAR
jgi:hypothetical protein